MIEGIDGAVCNDFNSDVDNDIDRNVAIVPIAIYMAMLRVLGDFSIQVVSIGSKRLT